LDLQLKAPGSPVGFDLYTLFTVKGIAFSTDADCELVDGAFGQASPACVPTYSRDLPFGSAAFDAARQWTRASGRNVLVKQKNEANGASWLKTPVRVRGNWEATFTYTTKGYFSFVVQTEGLAHSGKGAHSWSVVHDPQGGKKKKDNVLGFRDPRDELWHKKEGQEAKIGAGTHTVRLVYFHHLYQMYVYYDGKLLNIAKKVDWEKEIQSTTGMAYVGFYAKGRSSAVVSSFAFVNDEAALDNTILVEDKLARSLKGSHGTFHLDTRNKCTHPHFAPVRGQPFATRPVTLRHAHAVTAEQRVVVSATLVDTVTNGEEGVYEFSYVADSVGEYFVYLGAQKLGRVVVNPVRPLHSKFCWPDCEGDDWFYDGSTFD
jgi:hypothetical protein